MEMEMRIGMRMGMRMGMGMGMGIKMNVLGWDFFSLRMSSFPLILFGESKSGGYEIPAKTFVYVNAWAIRKDPEAWENLEEFYPERFIGSSIDYKGLDFELIPFGACRRSCPEIHMGIATVELALANFLYKSDWEMPTEMNNGDVDFDVIPGVTMHKKNALCLLARNMNV
ncbi:hypothetical protein PTKIN_Ptkin09bG0110000 [Pterospermum kingtungense]